MMQSTTNKRIMLSIAAAMALLAVLPLVWLALASTVLLVMLHRQDLLTPPYWQWADIAQMYTQTWWWPKVCIIVSGLAPTALGTAILAAYLRTTWRRRRSAKPGQIERGISDNHGHAAWMTGAAARAAFPGPDPAYGGKVVGMLPDGTLLVDPCTAVNGLSLEFAGSGGFKSSCAATTLVKWRGASVILDPSFELAPMLCEGMANSGKRVVILSPDVEPKLEDGSEAPWAPYVTAINVLAWVDVSQPMAGMHVHTIVGWMFGDDSPDDRSTDAAKFFRQGGKDLLTCLVAAVLWATEVVDSDGVVRPPPPPTLASVRWLIDQGPVGLRTLLATINRSSPSSMARNLAAPLVGDAVSEATWFGIYKEADQATSWLTVAPLCDLVSGGHNLTFRPGDIANERVSVFVHVPLDTLISTPPIARVLMGALFNAMIAADGKGENERVLFLIDEAARLGRMKSLELIRDAGRKYRVAAHLLWQSIGQMEGIWGPAGRKSWYDNATWHGHSSVRDNDAARDISNAAGTLGVQAYSEGDNAGRQSSGALFRWSRSRGRTLNRHEIKRPLIMPHEVVSDLDPTDIIILGLRQPLRLKRAMWWLRPEVRSMVESSRFSRKRA